ncbi:MAG: hypothetical protein PHO94_13385 [Petrimonas sp.]|nr:hypothetical protein [Petrimonas sp.]
MKKATISLFILFLGILVATSASAQEKKKDYFAGKWNILVKNTPNGDENATLIFERKDGRLQGTINRENGEVITINGLVEKPDTITGYFYAEGSNLNLFLAKKDRKTLTGSVMDQFQVEGTRVLPEKKK